MNNSDVSIKKWETTDATALAKALSNKNVLDNLRDGLPFPYTEKDALEYITTMREVNENGTFAFAIVYNEKVVGSIGVFRKDNIHNRTAELGYYLAEEHWGKGIMTQAVKMLCDFVFANSDIIRIFAEPFARNIGSCRVLEKAGFKFEGVLRSNAVKNGIVEDMRLYSRLRTDN
ncbi:MAG: GNAT family N-acetyltransferase [Clostridiales bacterium]|nr:GNAT family N-acetyltransferase [Clostridiales bacterium]